MKQEFFIPSADKCTTLHGYWWKPSGEVKGIVQIVHGMVEHIDRYDEFARYLNRHGFVVIGHDHLGHGSSIGEEKCRGFFAKENGKVILLKDMHTITRKAKAKYPQLPLFILGHSMGSFFLRRYLTIYGNEIDGAIIMGTGYQPLAAVKTGKGLAKIAKILHGDFYHSYLIHTLALGRYVGKFGNRKRPGFWSTQDEELAKKYKADKRCHFIFTVSAYYDFFSVLEDLAKCKNFDNIPRSLPLFLVSGMEDSVGGFTKGVLKVYNQYIALGMEDVDLRFYQKDRHEILNELDRDLVYDDIRDWLIKH